MKKVLLYTMALCAMMTLNACNDDDDAHTDSRLTTYPVLEMNGQTFVEVNLGDTYVDAGCKASLGAEDYTEKIVTTGLDELDTSTAGFYYVTYSVVNPEGYKASVTRTIAVFDPDVTTDLSGRYVTTENTVCHVIESGNNIILDGFDITLDYVLPGLFSVSDLLGGLYDQYVGYGEDYCMNGVIQLTDDNRIVILSGQVPAWGDSYDVKYDGTYDPETGIITWGLEYAGLYSFNVEIKPVTEEE